MKTQHFGIEIEMTGITRSKAASLMATFFGTGANTTQAELTIPTLQKTDRDGNGKP
jgi:hypothetical protein